MRTRPYPVLIGSAVIVAALVARPASAQHDCAPLSGPCAAPPAAIANPFVADPSNSLATTGTHAVAGDSSLPRADGADLTRRVPIVSLAPQGQSFRDASQGASTIAYSTPAYVSRDAPRSLSLLYASGQAAPMGVVDVQATDSSTDTPVQMSIRVRDPWGAWVTNEIFYAAGNGATRLAATWDAGAYGSGTYWFPVVVRSYWSDGTYSEAPAVNVGVVIVNERNSHAGVGWSLPGWQRIVGQTFNGPAGVTIVNGDGTALFFTRVCSPACAFTSPPGDWSVLVQNADGSYTRSYPDGSQTGYGAAGRIAWVRDRFGNQTAYTWMQLSDGTYVPSWITDPAGKSITMGYTAGGKLAWIQDPAGRVSNLSIDAAGDLTNVQTPALGSDAIVAQYDSQHRLAQAWDRSSALTTFSYDANGLLSGQQLAPVRLAGQSTDTRPTWYFTQQIARILPAPGKGTQANPAERRQPADVFASITDPRGNVRWLVTDRFGLPLRDVNPFGWATSIERNDSGQVVHVTTPSGHSVHYTWSGVELTRVRDETTGDSTVYEYEPAFHQATHVRGGGAQVWNTYGTRGELLTTRIGSSPVTTFTYDGTGRVLSAVDPEQHGTFYGYGGADNPGDNLHTVEVGAVSASNRRLTLMTYDAYGRLRTTYLPNGDTARVEYDLLNRTVRSVDGTGGVTRVFPGAVAVDSIIDPKGQAYRFYHNALRWVDSIADPNNHRERSYFDANGNTTSVTNRRGQSVSYAYDEMNRAMSRTADGATTTWSYAANDAWTMGANAESTDTVFYDAAGRPTSHVSVRAGVRYVLSSSYNSQGQRTAVTMTSPWSRSIGYRYTANAQIDTLIDLAGGRTLFDYNGDGQLTGVHLPNTVATLFDVTSTHADGNVEYNGLAQPHSLDRGYSVDPLGRVSARWNFAGDTSRAYGFDKAGRLTSYQDWHVVDATCSGTSFGVDNGTSACGTSPYRETTGLESSSGSYTYDAVGNRTDQNATLAWSNRLMSLGGYTMTYDADGNTTTKNGGGRNRTFSWNSLGQLVSVTTNGATTTYGYDAFGNRVRKTAPTGMLRYILDGHNLFMELDGSGNPVREYTYFPGVDQPHSMRSGTQTYYYLTEPSGTVVAMVNGQRAAVNSYQYDPWGAVTGLQEAVANPLRFAAREYDVETGLYYNRARYYDPELGRFISEDPIGLAGGINPFACGADDPVNRSDPAGMAPIELPGVVVSVPSIDLWAQDNDFWRKRGGFVNVGMFGWGGGPPATSCSGFGPGVCQMLHNGLSTLMKNPPSLVCAFLAQEAMDQFKAGNLRYYPHRVPGIGGWINKPPHPGLPGGTGVMYITVEGVYGPYAIPSQAEVTNSAIHETGHLWGMPDGHALIGAGRAGSGVYEMTAGRQAEMCVPTGHTENM
jgi:RHS repeat-associated protein